MNDQSKEKIVVGFQLSELDVICGKSKLARSWPGNTRFRTLIKQYAPMYKNYNKRKEKNRIIKMVAFLVQTQGGRFLIMSGAEKNHVFEEASFSYIYEKISHSLRSVRVISCMISPVIATGSYVHQHSTSTVPNDISLIYQYKRSFEDPLISANVLSYNPNEVLPQRQAPCVSIQHEINETFIVRDRSCDITRGVAYDQNMNQNNVFIDDFGIASFPMTLSEGSPKHQVLVTPPESPTSTEDMKQICPLEIDDVRNLLKSDFYPCPGDSGRNPFDNDKLDDTFYENVLCPREFSDNIFPYPLNDDNDAFHYGEEEDDAGGIFDHNDETVAASDLDDEISSLLAKMI